MLKTQRLGHHFEICFSVANIQDSISFYKKLGFKIYTGGADQDWCTLTDGMIYLALFSDNFIEKEFGIPVLFNYRGGNIEKVVTHLKEQEIIFSRENIKKNGLGDAVFTDPNGRVFYLDTVEEEERIDNPTIGEKTK
ncbi:MAG: hypothetical protein ACW98I_11930 [Candidatus Hodarchaeales archaeon]|jgi:catechol 2,3-dioxygenase-like lactoylglutathione lyase family enzyme